MENENIIKIDFAYTNEFGMKSRLIKSFNESVFIDRTEIDFLVEEFKNFLVGSGYSSLTVDKIQIVEEEE